MDPVVAAWLIKEVVAPDAYSRTIDAVRRQAWDRDVVRAVAGEHGRPGRRFKRWLRKGSTFDLLVQRTEQAFDELVTGLAQEEATRILGSREPDRVRAEALVVATIRAFLPALDPSLATAVVDHRAEHRHQEVLGRLDSARDLEEQLRLLPPPAAQLLREAANDQPVAERVVGAIVDGDPRATLRSWSLKTPDWLESASGPVFASMGRLAQAYGLRREATNFFESAAELGHDTQITLARAAFEAAAGGESDRAADLVLRARGLGPSEFGDVVAAAIAEDTSAVLDAGGADMTDPLLVVVRALALRSTDQLEEAISLLSTAAETWPDNASILVMLAETLLQRSADYRTTSRLADRRRAFDLAISARDERRSWRGDSGEAVEVACRAALLTSEYGEVVRIGAPAPRGQAYSEEAARPEVAFAVAQAAMALGDRGTADDAIADVAGFHKSLVEADLATHAGASQPEVARSYEEAWAQASEEDEKVAVWLSAANAGVDPLPGLDELEARSDELPALARGAQCLANGDIDGAARVLRPHRSSESACRLLVGVYVESGDIDAAVRELDDMSQRFGLAEPRVRAAELLATNGRLAEASEYADQALLSIPAGSGSRGLLHEVRVAAANEARSWQELESRARAWIDELGPSRRSAYSLAIARFNQADRAGAWQVIREAGKDPVDPHEAHIWIVLASEFRPGADTLSTILKLVEQHPDDSALRAAGVNAFFLMGDGKGEVSAETQARWQRLIQDRVEADDAADTFVSIEIPDDLAGLTDALRPYLEPQAQRVAEWTRKVRDEGFPYGMLALGAGRPYTTALIHRAAGFIPICSPSDEVRALELKAALDALDAGEAVVDNSALATGWHIQQVWPTLVGSLGGLYATDESRRDSAAALAAFQGNAAGTLRWDPTSDTPVLHEADPEELAQLEDHAVWVGDQCAGLAIRNPDGSAQDPRRSPDDLGPWMTCLETARSHRCSLWADDVGLRALSRNEGVAAFGSDSLLLALAEGQALTAQTGAEAVAALRNAYYVDFPLDAEWILALASGDAELAGPALLAVSRTPFWTEPDQGLALWERSIVEGGRRDPTAVASWVYAACVGVSRMVDPGQSIPLNAGLLVKSIGAVDGDPEAFAACVEAAAQGAAAMDRPEPVQFAFRMALELLAGEIGLQAAASELARLGSELAGERRSDLRKVLFEV